MCGRFTLVNLAQFTDLFPWIRGDDVNVPPRFNIAPTQPVLIARNTPTPRLELAQWGLVPAWAKDVSIGNKMINARAETLSEKPAFRTLLKRRRCVLPASGFYEWKRDPNSTAKTPMYIHLRDQGAFALAGLYDIWHSPDGSELMTCTIITTRPNELMAPIHDRMPVLLDAAAAREWLQPGEAMPVGVLQPFDAARMEAYPVSRAVNSPGTDRPSLIEPATPEPIADPATPKPSTPRAAKPKDADQLPLF